MSLTSISVISIWALHARSGQARIGSVACAISNRWVCCARARVARVRRARAARAGADLGSVLLRSFVSSRFLAASLSPGVALQSVIVMAPRHGAAAAAVTARKKKDCWKTPSLRLDTEDRTGVPDASWQDDEVRAWLAWWRPEEELRILCRCIGVGPILAKSDKHRGWTATAMRTKLRDYYQSPVQGAPPAVVRPAVVSTPEPEPEPEPEPKPELHGSDAHTASPAVFGGLPFECMVAVLDAGLVAIDLARLAIAVPELSPLLQDVAEERLARHSLRDKVPPRRPPPSLSIWHAAPTVAQRDFSGNELSTAQHGSGERLRMPLHILWELEGLATPLALSATPGSTLRVAEAGALVSRPAHPGKAESVAADVAAGAGVVTLGASAVCSRSVMRSGVHCAEFELVKMNEMDGGRGVRVGICRRGYLELSETSRGAAWLSAQDRPAQASDGARPSSREKPSATRGTDEYLRYLEWSRSRCAAASIFSTDHAWGFEARTGSLVHRGKRSWWRTKGVAPGVDIAT